MIHLHGHGTGTSTSTTQTSPISAPSCFCCYRLCVCSYCHTKQSLRLHRRCYYSHCCCAHTSIAYTLTDTHQHRDAARETQHGIQDNPVVPPTTRHFRLHARRRQHNKLEEEIHTAAFTAGTGLVVDQVTVLLVVTFLAQATTATTTLFGSLDDLIFSFILVLIILVVLGPKLLLHGFCPSKQKASY